VNNCSNATLSIPVGGTILWSNGSTNNSINVSVPGTYTVRRTLNGCQSAAGSGVAAPLGTQPIVSVVNNCGSSTLSIAPGGAILWSTGATTPSITVTVAGTYTVRRSINNCSNGVGSGVATPNRIPVVTASNVNTSATLNNCATSVSFGANVGVTGTPAPTVVYRIGTTVITSPRSFPVGNTTVTATATNSCGTGSASFVVTVTDNQSPTVSCKINTSRTISTATYTVSGTEFNATATDNCGTPALAFSLSGATTLAFNTANTSLAGRALNPGNTTVTWRATDASGNLATCTTVVTVTRVTTLTKQSSIDQSNTTVALKVSAMPNPTSTDFKLVTKSTSNEPLGITIYDATGRLMEKKTGIAANGSFQLGSHYPTGIYITEILQGEKKLTLRLIKIK
jgi:hypothetical protein